MVLETISTSFTTEQAWENEILMHTRGRSPTVQPGFEDLEGRGGLQLLKIIKSSINGDGAFKVQDIGGKKLFDPIDDQPFEVVPVIVGEGVLGEYIVGTFLDSATLNKTVIAGKWHHFA